jgi:hypothetical protein
MTTDHRPPTDPERPDEPARTPWFRRNRAGIGYHPTSWQGVLVLVAGVAVIAVIVILIKTVVF